MAEKRLHFLRVTDDTTREDLEQAMTHLRAKARRCKLAAYRAEIAEDIDDPIDLWKAQAGAAEPEPA